MCFKSFEPVEIRLTFKLICVNRLQLMGDVFQKSAACAINLQTRYVEIKTKTVLLVF